MKQSTKFFDRDILRQVLNLTAILAAFGVNVLANIAPFNGLTIGEISNTVFRNVLITPANYAF
ncbi:MAG: tryptophan-rich sensory protein, partial [Cyanobacteriota bacterium]|nr:tryptophan-rich sensory protein [Cyanobacteriota bacterium]